MEDSHEDQAILAIYTFRNTKNLFCCTSPFEYTNNHYINKLFSFDNDCLNTLLNYTKIILLIELKIYT